MINYIGKSYIKELKQHIIIIIILIIKLKLIN
jgi:hypothetical protein